MPKTNVQKSQIQIERDLCLLTSPELLKKYGKSRSVAWMMFRRITGKTPQEVAPTHNPFFYYAMSVWFDKPLGRSLIHAPRHRDEMADRLLNCALGNYDAKDGLHIEWPRRALKSTWLEAFADWVPKFHKYRDDMDIILLYSHNSERAAQRRTGAIKNKNRHHPFIKKYFAEPGRSFVIPDTEWGNKEEWDWPCREKDASVVECSMTAKSASSKKAGSGYHYKLLDDWEDEDSLKSLIVRQQLEDDYAQFRQLDAVPFSREVSVGTPYHLHGLQTAMLENKHEDGSSRYETLFMPALTDDNVPNFPTIPKLSVESLAKERANIIQRTGSDAFWYLQFQLDRRLTGFLSMEWDWFQIMTEEDLKKWSHIPHFRCLYGDTAWKGEENQLAGDWTVLMMIDHYIIGEQHPRVILDCWASQEAMSDEGADEACRLLKKWNTPYWSFEQSGEKSFNGMMRIKSRQHRIFPHYIDLKSWTKKRKKDRIARMAGHARMGQMYYMQNLPFLNKFKECVSNHPQNVNDDFLDCPANCFAPAIEENWIPVGAPMFQEEQANRGQPMVAATRYTGVPVLH